MRIHTALTGAALAGVRGQRGIRVSGHPGSGCADSSSPIAV